MWSVFASATLVKGGRAQPLSPPGPNLSAMDDPSNFIGDFPAATFAILAFCAACGHSGPLDRAKVPTGASIEDLPAKLRCSHCGAREASIRIVYAGAGGFRYGGMSPTSK